MKKEKVYLSGKITGIEEQAKELFGKAELLLNDDKVEVVNPMVLTHDHDKSWNSYMKECIKALCDCDSIYMLSNYMDSEGALLELYIAKRIGLKVYFE